MGGLQLRLYIVVNIPLILPMLVEDDRKVSIDERDDD